MRAFTRKDSLRRHFNRAGLNDLTPLRVQKNAESLGAAAEYNLALESDPLYMQHPATLALEERFERQLAIDLRITASQLERNWGDYSVNTKLNILQSIHNRQAKVYGFEPVPVTRMLESPRQGTIRNAHFDPGMGQKGMIGINIHPEAKIHAGAKEMLEMILHEGHHVWMIELANKLQSGTLGNDAPLNRLAEDASLCVLRTGLGMNNGDTAYARYLNDDMERRARRAADRVLNKISALQGQARPARATRRKALAAKP